MFWAVFKVGIAGEWSSWAFRARGFLVPVCPPPQLGTWRDMAGAQRMIEVCRTVETGPEQIFAVLADGWNYASWVVGAAHIRNVDDDWPAVGTRIHHRVGPWPLHISDQTVVRGMESNRSLDLEAYAWPIGAARIRLTLEPVSPTSTRVRLSETLSSGVGRLIPKPLLWLMLHPRNLEALHRLDDIAVHREGRS